ncbi:hypothetical protein [Providencia sneebia]|uniref:hypothetical protein n=1 Tax=Providencia sneebia TaxID=516075 RepID=UPI0002FDE60C
MASTISYSVKTGVDIKYAFCEIKTNGVPGVNNRDAVLDGIPAGTTATNSLLLLENGINTFTIDMSSPEWFSKEKKSEKEKDIFNENAYCKADVRFIDYKQGKVGSLGEINIKINEKGIPEAYLDNEIDKNIIKTIKKEYTQKLTKNKIMEVPENEYPNGMTIYQFDK